MKEAVSTLIYAAPRVEIPEFLVVRKQLELKFGKPFAEAAAENKDLAVNQRVMFKLGVKVPEPYLCVQYLKEIAREHNIKWDEDNVVTSVEVTGLNQNLFSQLGGTGQQPQNQLLDFSSTTPVNQSPQVISSQQPVNFQMTNTNLNAQPQNEEQKLINYSTKPIIGDDDIFAPTNVQQPTVKPSFQQPQQKLQQQSLDDELAARLAKLNEESKKGMSIR
jgi:hypothetical protein